MARPQKDGLDYFPLDVDISEDDKIALIEAKHGLIGFAIVIKLFMKIYKNGYFYKWTEKEQLLFSHAVNVDINLVNVIINDCLKWGIFSETMFEKFNILTSRGIQKRYLEATSRRKKVVLESKYLLVGEETISNYKNVYINSVNDDINSVNVDNNYHLININASKNPQSKVKNIEEEDHNPVKLYEKNFSFMTPMQMDSLWQWVDDFNGNAEVVCLAIKEAALKNPRSPFQYLESILIDWHKRKLFTKEDVLREKQRFENAKKQPVASPHVPSIREIDFSAGEDD